MNYCGSLCADFDSPSHRWGRLDCVEELMKRGAALETRDMWHKAPVDWALQADQTEVVQRMRIEAVSYTHLTLPTILLV